MPRPRRALRGSASMAIAVTAAARANARPAAVREKKASAASRSELRWGPGPTAPAMEGSAPAGAKPAPPRAAIRLGKPSAVSPVVPTVWLRSARCAWAPGPARHFRPRSARWDAGRRAAKAFAPPTKCAAPSITVPPTSASPGCRKQRPARTIVSAKRAAVSMECVATASVPASAKPAICPRPLGPAARFTSASPGEPALRAWAWACAPVPVRPERPSAAPLRRATSGATASTTTAMAWSTMARGARRARNA